MLSTVLLGAAGVCVPRPPDTLQQADNTDHRIHRWLPAARHSNGTLHWPRRLRAHIPGCRTPVAFLQQELRGLAPAAQRDITVQHRRRRAESWIVALGHGRESHGQDTSRS